MDSSPPVPATGFSGQKAVLFCRHCDRAVPFPEGWLDGTNGGPETVECPDCDHVIVRRSASDRRPTVTAVWTPYARVVSEWWGADESIGT
ncbi:hypothetical protein [Halococcoides cellulosivorans]|uniref:DUF8106 domain-containing protein n=1 Tax=Halococcoides cellulosivorans TaxID=1679096 RepID=A0A2R4WZP9_9EURY|nr:hypothetical protein [Halococcoides cellulosivorans]AWB27004.1 hypothetical protein HARCEL1_04405 [Halococcoides cellulosivorans]